MNSKFILILIYLLLILSSNTIAQNLEWAKRMGGNGDDWGQAITTDKNGYTYTTGSFVGTVDFDPSAGIYNLTAQNGSDVFITKLDANGNFIWAKNMGGISDAVGHSIVVDSFGNIYTTGFFDGTTDFDPNVGIFNITPTSTHCVFISKLDSLGSFIWAKAVERHIGNVMYSYTSAPSIVLDNIGNVYISSACNDVTIDFDPGLDTFNSTGGNVFVLKLDALGVFVWVKKITGAESEGLALDIMNNIYVAGSSASHTDIIVSKLDNGGNLIWTKTIDTPGFGKPFAIAVDSNSNVYTTGYFYYSVDFDPDTGVFNLFSNSAAKDVFILKLNSMGNFVWAKSIGGIGADESFAVKVDVAGNVYTTGFFGGTADFDPNAGVFNLTAANNYDIFISKLDAAGNFVWAKNMGGFATSGGMGITVGSDNSVYTTGYFYGTVDFDPNVGIYNLTAAGSGHDIFIHKMNQPPTPITKIENPITISLYPNPSSGTIQLEIAQDFRIANIEIINTLGQVLTRTQTSDRNSRLVLPDEAGIYFIRVDVDGKIGVYRVVNNQ